MILFGRRNSRKAGSRWMFRVAMLVALCALPGLAFSAGVSTPTKPMPKETLPQLPSVKPQHLSGPPTQRLESISSKVETPPPVAPASQDMTKTVKSLSSQVEALKKELDQIKKAEMGQSKAVRKPVR